ncbi:substrate-binding periplasmic protein [Marinomonas balearica]|uniref:Amino acid ABC transporter substrate-binding protein (PAAT family) n=1 Tax=Marinomonas balearica TaxID=491947 RepID=A0A4R6MB87_9GAMM|nr:transporter substrate-binding domain-containing protein [Marinomonas balearica]TDO98857.1 amino acid ABC transporter substrate-binding protein (PAAT family) [Marinomonas balearica]
MKNFAIAVQWVLICFCSSISFAGTPSLVTFYIVDYPPYLIESDKHGATSGMDVDIVRAAFREMNISATVKVMPWKRIIKSMKKGLIAGTISCSKRKDRIEYMLFSDPISQINQAAISATDKHIGNVSQVSDLAKYKVVGVEGWGVLNNLKKNGVPFHTTKNIENGITSILYRDVDVFFNGSETTKYQSKLMGVRDQLTFTPFVDSTATDLHLCISKPFTNSKELVTVFDQGLSRLKANGVYSSIRSRYLN